jgi:hypothetical protein
VINGLCSSRNARTREKEKGKLKIMEKKRAKVEEEDIKEMGILKMVKEGYIDPVVALEFGCSITHVRLMRINSQKSIWSSKESKEGTST